jgi:hypothetical protein
VEVDYKFGGCLLCYGTHTHESRILVRCGTEHEYGERGEGKYGRQRDGREDGERGSTGNKEMEGKIAWLYTLQAKLFPRTEQQRGEHRGTV